MIPMVASLSSLDVLVVDDDVERRGSYRALIGDLAGEVVAVRADGPLGSLLAERGFAAAVVHLDAPGGGDVEANLARLAAAGIPLIVISAAPSHMGVRFGGSAGAVDVLSAPIVPELLRAKVAVLVALQRARRDAARAEEKAGELSRQCEALEQALEAQARDAHLLRNVVGEQIHRTKNLLAIIQSIAMRTVSDGRPIGEARDALLGRLRALARAYQLVVSANGAGIEIADIVEAELGDAGHRVTVRGPPVRVAGSIVQTFALAMHELASNAVRHGALCGPEGSAAVSWAFFDHGGERYLDIAWREQGGAPVATPAKYGFGLSLVSSLGASGEVPSVRFEPQGLCCDMRLPQAVLVGA